MTLMAREMMEGPGFIGIGFGEQVMNGAEMWWCWVIEEQFNIFLIDLEGEDEECPSTNSVPKTTPMFACCLAEGGLHVIGDCSTPEDNVHYELEVMDWCLSESSSSVTIRAPVCNDDFTLDEHGSQQQPTSTKRNCFQLSTSADFIVAYNPLSGSRTHGYYRRTTSQVNLFAGILTQAESGTADEGLVATHGVFMLIAWMLAAPWAIYIARFAKTKSWRLVAHVSLMGFAGSLMIPLLIGVEASVGATDKTADHAVVGLILMCVYFVMALVGRIRYMRLEGVKLGHMATLASKIIHMYGGYVILGLAWWNCYTGLVRIGPEDSYFSLVVLSSFPLGYDIDAFGIIRKYVYFPYISVVALVFVITEYRRYRRNKNHSLKVAEEVSKRFSETALSGQDDTLNGCIFLTTIKDAELETMSMDTFLDVTRLGKALCIADGYVLDITDFMNFHPGGRRLLRYASGSDITEELLGRREIDRASHVHSPDAMKLLKTLITAKLIDSPFSGDDVDADEEAVASGASGRLMVNIGESFDKRQTADSNSKPPVRSRASRIFFPARVLEIKYLTPDIAINKGSKPVIMLRLSIPRSSLAAQEGKSFPPSCVFTFRGVGEKGVNVERKYTPVYLDRDIMRPSIALHEETQEKESEDEIFDFLISLIPKGQMSKVFLRLKPGKMLLVQGPNINASTLDTIGSKDWRYVVMIAAGTGISPMLQLINCYLDSESFPAMFLIWVLKGPAHKYSEEVGLKKLSKLSSGKFKWLIIYSSSKTTDLAPETDAYDDGTLRTRKSRLRSARASFDSKRSSSKRRSWGASSSRKQINGSLVSSMASNVREMIAVENDWRRRNSDVSIASNADSDMGMGIKFDRSFWANSANTSMASHYDEQVLSDILVSIDSYCRIINLPTIESGDSEDTTSITGEVTLEENKEPVRRTTSSDEKSSSRNEMSFHDDVLLAVSGSPYFEGSTLAILQGLGFPLKHVISFNTATDHV